MSRKKGALWSYIFMVAEMIASILFTPFLISSLGQSEYGIYSLVASVTAYLALLDMGVGNATIRYAAKFRANKEDANQRKLLGVTLLFYLIVALLVIVIGAILGKNLESIFGKGLSSAELLRAGELFQITVLNAAATLLFTPFGKTSHAYERFSFIKILAIAKLMLRVCIGVIALKLGAKGVVIVAINFAVTLAAGLIDAGYVFAKLRITPSFHNLDFAFFKTIIGYSAFVFIQMIATQINAMAAPVLLGMLVTQSAVIIAVYNVGALISQYFQSIAASINGVLMPGVVRMVEKGADSDHLLAEMVKVGRILFAILAFIWCAFLVIGRRFVTLWAGYENVLAYYVAVIIILPMVFSLTQAIGSQILWAKNKHKQQACLKILVALLNIGLTVWLIRFDPLFGAAIGTAVSLLVGDVFVMNIVYTKDIGISMKQYYRQLFHGIAPCLFLTLGAGTVFSLLLPSALHDMASFLIIGLVMAVSYAFGMWKWGANPYEKGLVVSAVQKVKKLISR